MTGGDIVAEVLETGLRWAPVPTRTGVREIGHPERDSPVLLTGNYDLTVRRVLRACRGVDAWLVVANSRGVNVWCASSGGHLGTHQVVTALKVSGLEARVARPVVIVPQLAATGVEGKEVRRRSGWIVLFGPADAADIPAFLRAGKRKTPEMSRMRFGWRRRLEMAAVWAAPISLVAAVAARAHAAGVLALVWTVTVGVFLLYDRVPLAQHLRQLAAVLAAVAGTAVVLAARGEIGAAAAAGWGIGAAATALLLTVDFAGSTPVGASGLIEDGRYRIALDVDACRGAWNCWAVCPENVFDRHRDVHKIAIARPDQCIRCGACVVQCPQDALAFEDASGRRIDPATTRRYKLNLLGQRRATARSA